MFNHPAFPPPLREMEDGIPVRKLFISNLAERTSNKDLERVFSFFGRIESCYLKRNNGRSNFAFLTYSNSADALKVREFARFEGLRLHCRILRVSPADSWHQPDSPENCRKLLYDKESRHERPQEEGDYHDTLIHMLNEDCLTEIFQYLPIADRIRLERVCKRWQEVSQKCWRTVRSLDLSSTTWGLNSWIRKQHVDTPALRKVLLKCGNFLNHIDFTHPHTLGSSALTIVGKFCPNLQTVDLSNMSLSQAGIRSLTENCKNITTFAMKSLTGPCEKDLAQFFAANQKLKTLKITKCSHMTGKCLLQLPCDTIEEIDLQNGYEILPVHFDEVLTKCKALRTLTLSSCACLGNSTFHAIGTVTTLTSLTLDGDFPVVSAIALNQISLLENLETLAIRNSYLLTDSFVTFIALGCKRLTSLDIYASELVTNVGLISIGSLPNLQHLVISHITSITAEALIGMKSLRTLECHRCVTFEDADVSNFIQRAPNLEWLDLCGCPITNNTILAAIKATKRRRNSTILKIVIGNTLTNLTEITEVSPLLQIINVSLDRDITGIHFNNERFADFFLL